MVFFIDIMESKILLRHSKYIKEHKKSKKFSIYTESNLNYEKTSKLVFLK